MDDVMGDRREEQGDILGESRDITRSLIGNIVSKS
jgi:hypothetical protein